MFELTFETQYGTVKKTAKDEKEVRKLVYIYTVGTQEQKEALIKEVISAKETEKLNEFIKPKKAKEDVSNL